MLKQKLSAILEPMQLRNQGNDGTYISFRVAHSYNLHKP